LRQRSFLVIGLLLALVMAACDGGDRSGREAEGGFGDPVWQPGEFAPGAVVAVSGTISLLPNGCWTIDVDGQEYVALFPLGFERPATDGEVINGPDDIVVRDGDAFRGSGRIVPQEQIPGGADGKWGNYSAFCGFDELVLIASFAR
jgi:hypothetical protein